MSTTSAFPGALDEFWNIADDPYMDEGGRLATDIITELQNAIAAVQASLGVTGALNYMRATGAVAQTVDGNKTFTGITSLRNGSPSGGLLIGADVNASTLTDNARKLFQLSLVNFANAQLAYCVLRADSNSTAASTALDIGGTGTAAAHGFPNVRIWTAPDINQPAVNRWLFGASGHLVPVVNGAYDFGAPSFRVRDVYSGSVRTSGSVSAGSDTPLARLHSEPSATSGKAIAGHFINRNATAGAEVALRFSATTSPDVRFTEIAVRNDDGANGFSMSLYGARGATLTRGVFINPDGLVGVGGNTSPSCALANPAFSQLGATDVPRRSHYITGTTSFTVGTPTNVAHGLDLGKILYYELLIQTGDSSGFTTQHANSVVHSVNATNFTITPQGSSTAGKAFRCSIWYRD